VTGPFAPQPLAVGVSYVRNACGLPQPAVRASSRRKAMGRQAVTSNTRRAVFGGFTAHMSAQLGPRRRWPWTRASFQRIGHIESRRGTKRLWRMRCSACSRARTNRAFRRCRLLAAPGRRSGGTRGQATLPLEVWRGNWPGAAFAVAAADRVGLPDQGPWRAVQDTSHVEAALPCSACVLTNVSAAAPADLSGERSSSAGPDRQIPRHYSRVHAWNFRHSFPPLSESRRQGNTVAVLPRARTTAPIFQRMFFGGQLPERFDYASIYAWNAKPIWFGGVHGCQFRRNGWWLRYTARGQACLLSWSKSRDWRLLRSVDQSG